ncbi:MAG: T9SS type A sorting domain-containing protein [Candidatus Fermentibacteraceae bacterium]|nr:T9SS type A sorting domain-containing protein [Candidatus Fermentibacteraceae bacterium]MBN2608222.1 T9SS type A sorting domain-containing protein [Candidatus Fermentibacteraceae bacterium]
MSPLYLFYNGPASCSFCSGRFSFYGVTVTPTVKIDGLASSSAPSAYTSTINNRLAVPCYFDIDVNMVGDASGGTAYISVTAEQEPSQTYPIKVWCVITEDHDMATESGWGGYTGMEMMWLPRAYPLGAQGQLLNFTGPYPQTLSVAGDYTLNPAAHQFDNLNVTTFVQYASGSRECLNADFMDLPDTATGIYGDETGYPPVPVLSAGPNPTTGAVTIDCSLPAEVTGTVQIFDITGRVVEIFPAQGTIETEIRESGVYFVLLNTTSGELVRQQITVIR